MKTQIHTVRAMKDDVREILIISQLKSRSIIWTFGMDTFVQIERVKFPIIGEVNNNRSARTTSRTQ